jgi:nitroreductase
MSSFPSPRQAERPVHPLFLERWSPRSYTGEEIPDKVLFSGFEAARWAPSSINSQPWRFLYSKRNSSTWALFLDLLNPNNRLWAAGASALLVVVSKKTAVTREGEVRPSRTHSFDTGAAWQNFALQITQTGWHSHAIGGFDRDKARAALNIPDDFAVEIAIAVGRQGEKSALPPDLQEREAPTPRRSIHELVMEGGFHAA